MVIYNSEQQKFVYRKDYWLANAFINTEIVNANELVLKLKKELRKHLDIAIQEKDKSGSFIKEFVKDRIEDDNFIEEMVEASKNINLQMSWKPIIRGFPLQKGDSIYNQAGYIEFEVEYFKDKPEKKQNIKPWIPHEFPVYVLIFLKKILKYSDIFALTEKNKNKEEGEKNLSNYDVMYLDEDSIYVTTICDDFQLDGSSTQVKWSPDSVNQHKQALYHWIFPYSGLWDSFDYQEEYVNAQLHGNLSLKTTELNYIRRNSAFLYLRTADFEKHFSGYYKKTILDSIGEIRNLSNSMMEVNKALDRLSTNLNTSAYVGVEVISDKIAKLDFLVGKIDSEISKLNNEIEVNPYKYYKIVLQHLLDIFDIEQITEWLHTKLDKLSNVLHKRYQKIQEQAQKSLQKTTFALNIFFFLGVLADIVVLVFYFMGAIAANQTFGQILSGIVIVIISGLWLFLGGYLFYIHSQRSEKTEIRKTVDGVIIHTRKIIMDGVEKEELVGVLVSREFKPFKDWLGLPGGFIEKGETEKQALLHEIWEETGLEVEKAVYIRKFDEKNRDPRPGRVISHAYLCEVKSLDRLRPATPKLSVEVLPIKEILNRKLPFDHKKIIKAGLKKYYELKKGKN